MGQDEGHEDDEDTKEARDTLHESEGSISLDLLLASQVPHCAPFRHLPDRVIANSPARI